MARLLAFAHLTRDGYFAEVSWRPTEQVVMNPVAPLVSARTFGKRNDLLC